MAARRAPRLRRPRPADSGICTSSIRRRPAATVERLTDTTADETEPRVSPDGRLVAFVSTLDAADGEADLWLLELTGRVVASANGLTRPDPVPLVRERGAEWSPAWAPDGVRLAYSVAHDDGGSIRIVDVDVPDAAAPSRRGTDDAETAPLRRLAPSGPGGLVAGRPDAARHRPRRTRPRLQRTAAARRRSVGRPSRRRPISARASSTRRRRPMRRRGRSGPRSAPRRPAALATFDAVWDALVRRAHPDAAAIAAWQALRDRTPSARRRGRRRRGARGRHRCADRGGAADRAGRSPAAAVWSCRRIRSRPRPAPASLRAGGNAIDAAIAASFALGVVEPDASGIGGDGMALVWRAGSQAPVVVDFKDQAPAAASLDNPAVLRDGRLVDHGPAALNVPGVVAGMDHLHRRYGSGRVAWAELVAPAIDYAGRRVRARRHPAGDGGGRPVDAATLRRRAGAVPARRPAAAAGRSASSTPIWRRRCALIATQGADAFYRGELAQRMVDDLARHGGMLSRDDLERYRVVERTAVRGVYRGHVVFSTPPPVASGTALIEILQTLDRQPPAPGGPTRRRRRGGAPADRDLPPRAPRPRRRSRRSGRTRARRTSIRHMRSRSSGGSIASTGRRGRRRPTRTAPPRRAAGPRPPPRTAAMASEHVSAAARRPWSSSIATATSSSSRRR